MSKTITISDETYDTIKDFCHSIATQDSRSTRIPYVYAIRDTKRIYGIDTEFAHDGYEWCAESGEEGFTTDEAFMDFIIENDYDHGVDLDEEESVYGFRKVYYVDTLTTRNIFLTEQGAHTHLKSYSYQYDDPDIKVIHLSGNTEILGLITSLNEIIN